MMRNNLFELVDGKNESNIFKYQNINQKKQRNIIYNVIFTRYLVHI